MKVFVTGHDGFIGRHIFKSLREIGYTPINKGYADIVMHCAAIANIPDSISNPLKCYYENISGTIGLINKMRDIDINNIIFLSTNAIDGEHPYGRSKKICEQIICESGLKYVILRYFNVAGCDPEVKGNWKHNYRLINMLVLAALNGTPFTLYGNGYQVRDYIHVTDACDITIKALQHLKNGGESYTAEVGTGIGHSIREIIAMVEKISGKKINIIDGGDRPGDVEYLVAKERAYGLKHSSLENIVRTTIQHYEAEQSNS